MVSQKNLGFSHKNFSNPKYKQCYISPQKISREYKDDDIKTTRDVISNSDDDDGDDDEDVVVVVKVEK